MSSYNRDTYIQLIYTARLLLNQFKSIKNGKEAIAFILLFGEYLRLVLCKYNKTEHKYYCSLQVSQDVLHNNHITTIIKLRHDICHFANIDSIRNHINYLKKYFDTVETYELAELLTIDETMYQYLLKIRSDDVFGLLQGMKF